MQDQSSKQVFNRIGLSFFLLMLVSNLVTIAAALLTALFIPQVAESNWYMWAVSIGPLYCAAFPVFMRNMRKVPDTVESGDLTKSYRPGARQFLVLLLACLGIVYPLNMIAAMLSTLLQSLTGTGLLNPLETVVSGSSTIVNLIVACLVAPIMEEIIFRWVLYKKLAGYGEKVYTLFSAFLFMIYHGNFFQMGYAFVLGLVFAWLTWRSGTIRYSIILHMILNFIGVGISSILMALTGMQGIVIWSSVLVTIVVVGLITAIVLFVKFRSMLQFEQGTLAAPAAKDMFLNTGMCLTIAQIFLLMAFAQIASSIAA